MACGLEEVVSWRTDMKELTLLEKVLVQILIASIDDGASEKYVLAVLQHAGLTKQQARRAVGWDDE